MNHRRPVFFSLICSIFLSLATISGNLNAQTGDANLDGALAELQATPLGSDSERTQQQEIIAMVLSMEGAPASSSAFRRFMARGEMAQEMATNASGYEATAREYRAATREAPWAADAYYKLGSAEEKAGNLDAAAIAYQMYLTAAPDAFDFNAVEEKVFRLEFQAEVAAKAPVTRQPEPTSGASAPLELPTLTRQELLFYVRPEGLPQPRNMKSVASDFPNLSSYTSSGKVLVSFDIEENGRTSNLQIIRATRKGAYDDEAKTVVKKLRFEKGTPIRGVIYDFSFCKASDRLRKLICDIRFEKANEAAENAPRLLKFAVPTYNTNAVRRGICGAVNIRFDVNSEGLVSNSRIVTASGAGGQFGFNVKEAVDTFKFAGGSPTSGVEYKVSFGLPGTCSPS
ncbi:MAG: TonB family protein [Sphingomonadales bacterium]